MLISGLSPEQYTRARALLKHAHVVEEELASYRAWIRLTNELMQETRQDAELDDVREPWSFSGQQMTAHLRRRHPGLRALGAGADPQVWGDRYNRHFQHHYGWQHTLDHIHPLLERAVELQLLAELQVHEPPRAEPDRPRTGERPPISARGRPARFRRAGLGTN
jgi:hypothetical protein